MAADRPLADRGFVEIKMGRSKFPGKPCKIGNRRRVNLSSCALPEDNDSSKAAKNIYLGLSVFNETFGDNEMVAPGPFYGFSMSEVEEAIAEARLQHNEAELEVKKHGLNINFWESFQNELISIMSCSSYGHSNSQEIKKAKLSFDGGGASKSLTQKQLTNVKAPPFDEQPFIGFRNITGGHKNLKTRELRNSTPEKKVKTVKFLSPKVKLMRLQCSHSPRKSLQSQAAKRLLEKAKMSNLFESNKNNSSEKKFILPTCSIHSSRVIKTNKRYIDDCASKRKLLRSRTLIGASDSKKPKSLNPSIREEKQGEESKGDFRTNECKKKSNKTDCSGEFKNSESDKGGLQLSGNGKVILREARLQLDNSNVTLLEGPFSSPSASGLNSNSHLKINPIQAGASSSVKCGVCGIVGVYKFVGTAKKFGIYCCESCQKFISKIMKLCDSEKNSKMKCIQGKGLCGIVAFPKGQPLNGKELIESRCSACWLKQCLKSFKMPVRLKQKLVKLLPMKMQFGINMSLSLPGNSGSKFMLGNNNIKGFNWLNENFKNSNEIKFSDKHIGWPTALESNNGAEEKSSRKRNWPGGNENKSGKQGEKIKSEADEKSRQSIALKGPRVKHVCRSASVVLGQPLATFPSEISPAKKETNETDENCKNCDGLLTTNGGGESQEAADKTSADETGQTEKAQNNPKEANGAKSQMAGNGAQQSAANKAKKKANVKTENPISMDFWECYDPDEVCETGFGLIGSEPFSVRALCFLCGSSGQEKLIHCASCCEPYHEFCVNEGQQKLQGGSWKYDWVCPRCTVCYTCGKTSGQQLKCIKCDNSYHTECVDRVGGRLLYSPDRPWVCSVCLRCKSCNGVDVSVFVGNLPLCKTCFVLRQKGNYCPLCQRCYEDDDYDSKMMECGECKCWVHAKCEGLSDEKYQVLSFLPESVEYICRMCCVMPPAPWWIAVEAELKSGYLGVLKALSKNRKACAMLKWSPRKQCTCRHVRSVSRTLDMDDPKGVKSANDSCSARGKENNSGDKGKDEKYQPGAIAERKTSIEVINHPTESLKLTLKILKGADGEDKDSPAFAEETCRVNKYNDKESTLRVKKCLSTEDSSEDSLTNTFDCPEDSQISLNCLFKGNDFGVSSEFPDKRTLSSPLNPPSDSGIGSTDDELKASCLTDEEGCKPDEQQQKSAPAVAKKSNCDTLVAFLEEKRECFCFLDVDSYNSRSKPFSPNLMSIKKKVTTSEYTSLHQFHEDMQGMIATTQSTELMELYHQTIKEIFPWFDPKYSRVQSNSQKVSGTASVESTPTKKTPTKSSVSEECKIPREKLTGQDLNYFYGGHVVQDDRVCVMCKTVGDGPPEDTGRLLYCGQNDWVHCNCALWSGEVFEEIDGSLQNVHSAINRGRSIRCPECNLKGASIGCCARNCQETYHFRCARLIGCIFMDDKTVYCPSHVKESMGKLVQNEKELEVRRPVYVELDKRKMKTVDSSQIRFVVGALQVNALGRFAVKLSDQPDAIIPDQFHCTRWFWSCYEPWRIVRYHFTVRLLEVEDDEGIDCGINLTVDHSVEPELLELKLKQLKYFQDHNALLEINEKFVEEKLREKRKLVEAKTAADESMKNKLEEGVKVTPVKRSKKDSKAAKKVLENFDSRDEENCLVDNQNTADLLPPDLEEAIFRDLPHDILDGISMQDIFMDIKNDAYENNMKESLAEEEDVSENVFSKHKRQDYQLETVNQVEMWMDSNEIRQETADESFSKSARDQKRSKVEGPNQTKKVPTLRTYQKSCGFNWNVKSDGSCNKLKKSPKCHVTVNLFESQERNSLLQELKFPDDLVTVTTGPIDSIKDLKSRLEDTKCSIQQEEGKENKCLPWHACLQPRLLQVDGNVDSSSSSSEAGESPQRLVDDTNSKIVPPPQMSPFLDSPLYSNGSPGLDSDVDAHDSRKPFPGFPLGYYYENSPSEHKLPQLDGVNDGSDLEDFPAKDIRVHKRPKRETKTKTKIDFTFKKFAGKINQCDGGVDSESDGDEIAKAVPDDLPSPLRTSPTKDEPVKCKQCHCTYRTKLSYQRHLDTCCSDFILSSSEGEMSEDDSPKKSSNAMNGSIRARTENEVEIEAEERKQADTSQTFSNQASSTREQSPDGEERLEVKKKVIKRTYARKRPVQISKKVPITSASAGVQQVQQVLVQQPSTGPTLIVQDLPRPGIVPAAFAEASHTIGYVTPIESQNPFSKPQLIAVPNGIIPGNFPFSATPEAQMIGGLCLNAQQIQTNVPGFIIQQPQSAPLIAPQSGTFMMSGEQMMLGPAFPAGAVIQDPGTAGMFIANQNQPIFYNMETVVNNVVQTNQFVSNVIASSFTQTSTQIFQTHETEHVVNLPTNYLLLGPGPSPNKILPPEGLICIHAPQTLIPNQTPIQIPNQPLLGASFQTRQPVNSESKLPTQMNSVRLPQMQSCPSIVVNKVANGNTQVYHGPNPGSGSALAKPKPAVTTMTGSGQVRSMPMMRPNVSKSSPRGYEKAVITPKHKFQHIQPRSRSLVDYINNYRPDAADSYVSKESAPVDTESGNSIEDQMVPERDVNVTANFDEVPVLSKLSRNSRPEVSFDIRIVGTPSVSPKKMSPSKNIPKDSVRGDSDCGITSPRKAPDVNGKNETPEPAPVVSRDSTPEKTKTEKTESPKVLANMTNSISFGRESKLSMPLLEDSPQDQMKSYLDVSTTEGNQPGEVLPLQEGSQPYAAECLVGHKSPQQNSPAKNKSPVSDEKAKKKKALSFDQNLLDVLTLPGFQGKEEEAGKKRQFQVKRKPEEKGPKLIFDVISDDGFKSSSTSMVELWANICDSVQEMRAVLKIPPLPVSKKGSEILGMQNHGLQHCLEQLKGVEQCIKYRCKYFVRESPRKGEEEEEVEKENLSGCARTEQFASRKEYDMFAWLASRHRQLPKLTESAEEILSSIRRANSLPMAMRYRNLKETSKLYLGVYRSKIHGRGLFCLREIEAGEMVIEYAGEVIRSNLTDKREKYYTEKGIGCYMFRIDDHFVVDATMKGNAARFINHSCEPNCYSRVVDVLGKKHIVIFALRRINIMEELTYDYKFPFEDEKISCHCLSKKCRKYLN